MALTRSAILDQVRAVVDGAQTVGAFNAWLASYSWNMHLHGVPQDVQDLVALLENDLAEQPDAASVVNTWRTRLTAMRPVGGSVSEYSGESHSFVRVVSERLQVSVSLPQASVV